MSTATDEQRTNTLFYRVMESAPLWLLIFAALGLAIAGVFQFLFYLHILPTAWPSALTSCISAALALFFEGLGFYFLVTTVRDFSAGARREGAIGLTATFLLWAYALWECVHISASFDSNTPESFWSICGILGTIVCLVRIVELRITLTVTSAYQRIDEVAVITAELEADRKQLEIVTGKLLHLEAEKQAANNRKLEAEKRQQEEQQRLFELEQAEIRRQQEEQLREAIEEAERLRRQLARVEKKEPATTGKVKINPDHVAAHVRKFLKMSNGIAPSQRQVAAHFQVDERTVRNAFPNGSWDALISAITTTEQTEFSHS